MARRIGFARGLLLATAVALLAGCQAAPVTGRQQLLLISDAEANQLGVQAYQQIRAESRISRNPRWNQVVHNVGWGIARASGANYDWQFTVFEDPEPNAFCLPGGKVGVNTGMFDVARNEAQLAAVLGHEVAHAVARHAAERMSRQALVQAGLSAVGPGAGQYAQLLGAAATLGVILPFSREQEAEADEIGLIYMARAGYDPRQAINLWRNMQAARGDGPPAFLSTHPAPGNRIAMLEAQMPRAMSIYQASRR